MDRVRNDARADAPPASTSCKRMVSTHSFTHSAAHSLSAVPVTVALPSFNVRAFCWMRRQVPGVR